MDRVEPSSLPELWKINDNQPSGSHYERRGTGLGRKLTQFPKNLNYTQKETCLFKVIWCVFVSNVYRDNQVSSQTEYCIYCSYIKLTRLMRGSVK